MNVMSGTLPSAPEAWNRGVGMARLWALAIAVLWALAACAPQPHGVGSPSTAYAPVTRSQVISDIDYALTALADMHPNLYWRADQRDISNLKQELTSQLPAAPTALDIYVAFLRLTAAFNDAHVSVTEFPGELRGTDGKFLFDIYKEAGVFPAAFDPAEDSLRVVSAGVDHGALVPGDAVVAVNGVSAHDLLSRIEGIIAGSGATKHFAAREDFRMMLWIEGIKAPFRVDLGPRGDSGPRTLTLPAATSTEIAEISRENHRDPIEYRLLEDRLGLITFRDLTEEPDRFMDRLVDMFDRVKRDRPRGIVVDLRRNSGGNSGLGDMLLAFINDKAYRPFAERRWKISHTCQRWYGALKGKERSFFDEYLAATAGETLVSPQSPGRRLPLVARVYDGPVAALVGPGTISSAAILADAMKTFHLATLFGQPIGEPANMYGEVCETTLPQTGIRIGAPSGLYIRADGDAQSTDPVVPDVVVEDGPSIDRTLDAARRWLLSQPGTS